MQTVNSGANVEQHWIESGGARLFVQSEGCGELLLFLHGFPEHGLVWHPLLPFFRERYQVAALDSLGHGRSDCPQDKDRYRIERLVDDVLRVAEHLGADRFTLIGHDWGGVLAWFVAALHPERVSRLVVVNAPHATLFQRVLDEDIEQGRSSAYLGLLSAPDAADRLTPEVLWNATLQSSEDAGLIAPRERAVLLDSWRRPGAIMAMLNWYRSAPFDFSAVGGTGAGRQAGELPVTVPTLVVWGMADPLLQPTLLDGLSDLVGDLRVERLADVGHSPVRECPDVIGALIASYLGTRSK